MNAPIVDIAPVLVPRHELRALLRIATEFRDPSWKRETWIINLAAASGLDLNDPEGAKARRAG